MLVTTYSAAARTSVCCVAFAFAGSSSFPGDTNPATNGAIENASHPITKPLFRNDEKSPRLPKNTRNAPHASCVTKLQYTSTAPKSRPEPGRDGSTGNHWHVPPTPSGRSNLRVVPYTDASYAPHATDSSVAASASSDTHSPTQTRPPA